MSTQVQYRRGTEAQNNVFTGALAEITVDTTNWNLRIHDGVTPGGVPLITANSTSIITNKTYQGVSLSVTGNVSGNNLSISELATVKDLTVTGNLLAGDIGVSSIANGTSNVDIVGTSGNVSTSVGGVVDVLVATTTGIVVNGIASVSGNITSGNVNTTGLISVSGNVVAGGVKTDNIYYANGTPWDMQQPSGANTQIQFNDNGNFGASANLTFNSATNTLSATNVGATVVSASGNVTGSQFNGSGAGLTAIPGANVTGTVANATYATSAGSATTAGTVTGNAQANITSVGTLTSLSVTGNVVGGGITLSGNTIFAADSTLTIDPSAPGVTGTVVIAGNLTVQGTTTTYDSTTVTINDLVFTVANNAATASAANGGGLEVGPAGSAYATLTYDQPNSRWSTALGIGASGNITGGNLLTGGLISATGAVTGSQFNGSGAGLTSIPGANVTGTVANATYATSAGSATTAGTVTTAAQGNITSVGTLTSLSVSGNVQGGNLRTAGLVSATGQITGLQFNGSGAGLSSIPGGNVTGTVANATYATSAGSATSATTAGTVTTAAQGNITSVGTLTSLSVSGNITSSTGHVGPMFTNNIVNTGANGTGNIGSASLFFNTVFAKATSAQYADLAEKYLADADYEPGTVLSFGGSEEVTMSAQPADPRVVGVVTTTPSYVMNAGLEGQHVVTVALIGRVPTKVTGSVRKGDFMVAGGNGYAMSCTAPAIGTVIGKAIQDFNGESGMIEILVNNH